MRQDMGRVIIERPRGNSGAPSAKARDYGKFIHTEDGLEYEGFTRLPVSRKQEGYHKKLGSKSFSDVLGPLYNYLRSNCGRQWNDVYSEIARTIGRSGSYGIRHILGAHLDVATCTYRDSDGVIWACDKHGVNRTGGFHHDFYVDPETGILRPAANYRKWRTLAALRRPKSPVDHVPLGDGKEYRLMHGAWFYHEFAIVTVETPVRRSWGGTYMKKETREVTVWKRQLGKKELRDAGFQKRR